MAYSILFGVACIGLVLTTIVWSAMLFIPRRDNLLMLFGHVGTLCASIHILGAWLPDTFEPLWLVVQLTFMAWLMSFVLIGLPILLVFVLRGPRRERVTAIVFGSIGLLLNGVAMLAFLWNATVSPGGV